MITIETTFHLHTYHHGILVKCFKGIFDSGSMLILCAYFMEFIPTLHKMITTANSMGTNKDALDDYISEQG